jgi:glycosyltransferase involved in cell wall biosynthesis
MKNDIVWLITVYKNDKLEHVKEMFESIFNQKMKKYDIFVQEDGILPGCVHEYLLRLKNKKKIKHLGVRYTNKGLAFSLNELIEKVHDIDYKYLVRMDADDLCSEKRLKLQYEFLEANPKIDVVGALIEEFNEEGLSNIVTYKEKHEDIKKHFSKRCPIAHVTCVFRSSFFKKAGLYRTDTIHNEDQSLWIDGFSNKCYFHNLQQVLVKVRAPESYMKRRSELKHALDLLKLKLEATWKLKYGVIGIVYAFALFFVMICPINIKKYMYEKFRT